MPEPSSDDDAATSEPVSAVSAVSAASAGSDSAQQNRTLLRGYGLRTTRQRLAVLRLLGAGVPSSPARSPGAPPAHLGATQIHEGLVAEGHHLDIATVYRTLATLVDLGIVHAVSHTPNVTTYGLAGSRHHHAVCLGCGAVADIPSDRLGPTLAIVLESTGFRVEGASVTVNGLCRRCESEHATIP